MRVLVMGLPGSGKTTLCRKLLKHFDGATHLNADTIRGQVDDWDFSREGRLRQAHRMKALSSGPGLYLVDMVAALKDQRDILEPDIVIHMDTIQASRFEDTNQAFEAPTPGENPECLTVKRFDMNPMEAVVYLINAIERLPVGVMIGRFQPWHKGHRELMERVLMKHPRVVIMVRDTHGKPGNPLTYEQVKDKIETDLGGDYEHTVEIMMVPDIAGVYYGRDVGYNVERIHLTPDIESIRATSIRKEQGL